MVILKEDTPALVQRPAVLRRSPSSSSSFSPGRGLQDRSGPASSPAQSLPPSYRPPSFPPAAHLPVPDPAPYRGRPPPRYKFRKRPARFIPLGMSVAMAGFVLGSCIHFIVESMIAIGTTHIKPQMFEVFGEILEPTHWLGAASILTLVALPIHHFLPFPAARTSFKTAPTRQQILIVLRILLPTSSSVLYIVSGSWYFSISLKKSVDSDPTDEWVPIGDGVKIRPDPHFPGEGDLWSPWFYSDPNVKLVVYSTLFAAILSVVYLLNAFPGNAVHRFFTGVPPKWLGSLETRLQRWWSWVVSGGDDARWKDEEEEMEGMMAEEERVGVVEPDMDDQMERTRRRLRGMLRWDER